MDGWRYRVAALVAGLFALANTSIAGMLGDPGDCAVILANKTLIQHETVLWDGSDAIPSIGRSDVRFIATPHALHDDLDNLEIRYATGEKHVSLFKETGAPGNGDRLIRVMVGEIWPILLLESESVSQGATGAGSRKTYLHLFLFDETDISGRTFALGKEYFPGSAQTDSATYRLNLNGNPPALSIDSYVGRRIHELNLGSLSVREPSGIVQFDPRPSYDCTQASGVVELRICKDPGLATLDRVMANIYQRSKTGPDTLESQARWLRHRNECGELSELMLPGCLAERYRERIAELTDAIAGPPESN